MKDINVLQLLDYVKNIYGLNECEAEETISMNPPTFKIRSMNKLYFLKVNNRPVYDKYMDTITKYEIVDMLHKRRIKTPQVYRVSNTIINNEVYAIKGKFFFIYNNFEADLSEWFEFDKYSTKSVKSFYSTIEFCLMLQEDFSYIFKERESFSKDTEDEIRKNINQYIIDEEFDFEKFKKGINEYLYEYTSLIYSVNSYLCLKKEKIIYSLAKMPISYIHADINLKNIGYIDNKAYILMDFERLRYGLSIEDMSMCMFELCINNCEKNQINDNIYKFIDKVKMEDYLDVILYIICSRLQRHVYRGIENMIKGRKVHGSFYSVFVEGLEKTYNYINSTE